MTIAQNFTSNLTSNFTSTLIAKANNNPYVAATLIQAEEIFSLAQTSLIAKTEESTIRASKLAQKNLLTLAKGADTLSKTLSDLAEKLEPASKPIVIKTKPAAKKPVAKAAAKTKSAPKAKTKAVTSRAPVAADALAA
jgi:hypothetical protein